MEQLELVSLARGAAGHAYAPYSGHQAGAALLAADGSVHLGANVEIAGSTASCCAARVALAAAAAAGVQNISAIALTSDLPGETPALCGVCRQTLAEFCAPDTPVLLTDGGEVLETTVGALLPGWKFSPPRWPETGHVDLPAYPAGSPQELISLALAARERCYAPYSNYYVGAALRAASGRVYLGGNVEAAGRTPTVCAERSALFQAVYAGERAFTGLAVVGALKGTPSGGFAHANPCAVCRQALAEFDGGGLACYLARTPDDYLEMSLGELLPHAFRSTSYQ